MRLKPMVSVAILLRFIRFKLNLHAAEAGGVSEFSHSLGSRRYYVLLSLTSSRRSVIVDDLPPGLRFAKQQGEGSMRLVVSSLQTPAAQNQRRVLTQHCDFEIRKCQRSHLLARVVILFVAIEDRLPSATNVVAADKFCVRRAIIAIHVAFDVAAIPRVTLRVEDGADGGFAGRIGFIRLRRRCGLSKEDNTQCDEIEQASHVVKNSSCN